MKISIIIPTYNCGRYIKKAIDSILMQSYNNKEVIVIDGGGTDNTVDILKSYGDKIKWISEKDKGQADAINKGFKLATGDVCAWLNADDYYEPNIFDSVLEKFQDNNVVLVYGKCRTLYRDKVEINLPPIEITWEEMVKDGNYLYQPSTFYRTETIRQVGYLNDSLHYWMEYDLFIKLCKSGKSIFLDKELSNFLVRDDQKSNKRNFLKMHNEMLRISRHHGGNFFSKMLLSNIFLKIKFIVKLI